MEGWKRGGELLLVQGQGQVVADRSWFPGIGPSVYFSHFSNQLIADLCEFFNLLILWWCSKGGRVTKQHRTHAKKGCSVYECSQRGVFTLWSRACSRDSFFICSFLRLAVSAVLSELALERTWAISSLALYTQTKGEMNNCSKSQM